MSTDTRIFATALKGMVNGAELPHTGSQDAAANALAEIAKRKPSMLDLLKKAQAEALDPQMHEVGAAVKTLDQAIAMLES